MGPRRSRGRSSSQAVPWKEVASGENRFDDAFDLVAVQDVAERARLRTRHGDPCDPPRGPPILGDVDVEASPWITRERRRALVHLGARSRRLPQRSVVRPWRRSVKPSSAGRTRSARGW
jgi:hypothetical protein